MSYSTATLEKLAQLRREGALSEDEFSGLKTKLFSSPAAPLWTAAPPPADTQLIRRISEYMRFTGIAWIVIGTLQICMIVTALAGIGNVFAGRSRLVLAKEIARRDPGVVESVFDTRQLVVLGVINLLLGTVVGVVMVGMDFYVRDQILTNERLFTGLQEDL